MMTFEEKKNKLLQKLQIDELSILGKGVESYVYSYGNNQVVRILKKGDVNLLNSLKNLQMLIVESHLCVNTPLIERIGEYEGIVYTFEKKFKGGNLSRIFDHFDDKQKEIAILNYFDRLDELKKIDVSQYNYGQIVETEDKISETDWREFLTKKVKQKTDLVRKQLEKDVLDFESKLSLFYICTQNRLKSVEKNLVHGDYFYDNVMINYKQEITGILDFSGWTTVVGDYKLDVCGSIIFLEHSERFVKYQALLLNISEKRYGKEIRWYLDFYRIYYCLFLSDSYLYLKPLYNWCVKNLNNRQLWRSLEV